jgi:outer membrane biogenesis lipoprotein LolB
MRAQVERDGTAPFAVLGLLLVAFFSSGCETLPPASVPPSSKVSIAASFSLDGRLSVRVGERLDSVKLLWLKGADSEKLQFFTPFGSQLAELSQDEGGPAILLRGKEVTQAASVRALTESFIGIALDTNEIGRWAQGVGLDDGVPRDFQLDDGSHWQVTAERMQTATTAERPGEVFRHAAKIKAVKGDIIIRLVIDEWRPR